MLFSPALFGTILLFDISYFCTGTVNKDKRIAVDRIIKGSGSVVKYDFDGTAVVGIGEVQYLTVYGICTFTVRVKGIDEVSVFLIRPSTDQRGTFSAVRFD